MFAPEGGGGEKSGDGAIIAAARRVATGVLAPAAEATDQADRVPPGHLRALAGAGLFGLFGPAPASAPAVRAVFEALAGACGATFFVWVQHHAPVRLLAASPNAALRERLLPELTSGRMLGGVAFAHLRRPGPPAVTARPGPGGGWVLDGRAPWVTSWGMARLFAVAALTGEGTVVFSAVAAGAAGLRPSEPLRLAAMGASSTVRLGFDCVEVPRGEVIAELPLEAWRSQDRAATARPNPAAFGVAATCVRMLGEVDPRAAGALSAELGSLRAASYALDDEPAPDPDRLVALRARSLELAVRSAHALVAATGGRAMELSHPAQRLLREAAFYAIQAQTPALRAATLDLLAPAPPRPG